MIQWRQYGKTGENQLRRFTYAECGRTDWLLNWSTAIGEMGRACRGAGAAVQGRVCALMSLKGTMFRIFKHNKHPEYRLIVPRHAELPSEMREEWTACDLTDRVEAEQQEEIERSGYCLFRSGAQ